MGFNTSNDVLMTWRRGF